MSTVPLQIIILLAVFSHTDRSVLTVRRCLKHKTTDPINSLLCPGRGTDLMKVRCRNIHVNAHYMHKHYVEEYSTISHLVYMYIHMHICTVCINTYSIEALIMQESDSTVHFVIIHVLRLLLTYNHFYSLYM